MYWGYSRYQEGRPDRYQVVWVFSASFGYWVNYDWNDIDYPESQRVWVDGNVYRWGNFQGYYPVDY